MSTSRWLWIGATVLTGMLATNVAHGADAPSPPPAPDQARGWETPPGTTPEDVALFVPRVVLFVPRLLLTLAFYPIEAGLRFVSRRIGGSSGSGGDHEVRSVAVLPHLSYLTGFGTSVGASARYENLGGYDEEAALAAIAGGVFAQAFEASFHADRTAGSRVWLESRARYEVRPQAVFRGIGDGEGSTEGRETRFRESRLTVLERAGVTIGERGRLVKVGATGLYTRSSFGPKDDTTGEPSIEQAYDTRSLVGFARGARTLEIQSNLVVDTRDALAATSTGVLANAFAGVVPPLDGNAFGHLGVDVTTYVDLSRKTRVLILRAAVEGVLAPERDLPFARLVTLGGPETLRGYRLDRYRDRESALLTAEYRYPIHRLVAGAIFVDAGHVARDPAQLATLSRWRADGGVGIRIRSSDSVLASLDLAYGDGVQLFFSVFPFDSRAQWNKP